MFLTLIHHGGGSMVEASDAIEVFGPFETLDEANAAGNDFYDAVKHHEYYCDDIWDTVVEIPSAPVNIKEAAKKLLEDEGV